jgi:hypothetical protein
MLDFYTDFQGIHQQAYQLNEQLFWGKNSLLLFQRKVYQKRHELLQYEAMCYQVAQLQELQQVLSSLEYDDMEE